MLVSSAEKEEKVCQVISHKVAKDVCEGSRYEARLAEVSGVHHGREVREAESEREVVKRDRKCFLLLFIFSPHCVTAEKGSFLSLGQRIRGTHALTYSLFPSGRICSFAAFSYARAINA